MGFFESQHKYELWQFPKPLTFATRTQPARTIDRGAHKGLILFFPAKTTQVCSFLSAVFELLVFSSSGAHTGLLA